MAQHDFVINNQGFPSFRSDLNDFLNAVRTSHSGTSLPSGAVAGTIWLDTTNATTPILKYYDGTDNITLATINHSTNTVDFNDSSITTPLTVTGNSTAGAELRLPEDTDNGSNYVALKAPDTLASNLTFTLPSSDGSANQVLTTNGSGVLSFTTVGGLAWQSIVTASTLTAVAGRGYWIDTTSNACTVTLPASATNGDTIVLADYARKWATNAVTINTNSLKFQGNTTPSPIYNTDGQSVTLIYSGATQGWIPTVDDNVTLETPQPYSIDFLVIAGGGGGGACGSGSEWQTGGGGGAGGYRTSTQSVAKETVITVTVGDGGAGQANTAGTKGSDSSISGSGITTITSTGGGLGGGANTSAGSGGSGGGGTAYSPPSAGSGNTPSTSPSQGNNGGSGHNAPDGLSGAGGGGGAGATGTSSTSANGGAGGNGTASSITGSSVTRAGGGGGSKGYNAGNYGSGGTGGGGTGGSSAGTANLGGGGGGNTVFTTGYAGGKGVVILSVPTANYSGITTGSPTVTTSGSNTILQFNGSGSYTA